MAWFTAKEWKNRLVEFAGRRSLKNVSTNETTVYDVTRNEGQVSQEGDSFSATTMNDLEQRISDAFAEAEEANQLISELQNLKTYTALSQLGLSAPVTMEQIYSQMPSSSFFITGVGGTGDISNLPENDPYGIIEIFKRDRNFARFTPSLSSAMAGSMFYGTFSWSGGVAFTGWKRIIDDKRLANNLTTTAEGYGLDARQGKVLMNKANQLISDLGGCRFGYTEDGQPGWKEQGADTVYPFLKTVEIAGSVSLEKVGTPNDDKAYARIDAPDGFEISQIIYSSSGFSTNMYYNFNVGGTTIGNQERSNVTNRKLDISSAQDRSFLQVLIRQYNESSSGTGSVSYTIQFKRKAG